MVIIYIAVIMSGISSGVSFSHILETPGKNTLSGAEFLHVHHTFYGGYAWFGAITWMYTVIAGFGVFIAMRNTIRRVAICCLAAAICFTICIVIFGLFLRNYNYQIAHWTDSSIPLGWREIRNRWELCHAVIFGLSLAAFILFFQSTKYAIIYSARVNTRAI